MWDASLIDKPERARHMTVKPDLADTHFSTAEAARYIKSRPGTLEHWRIVGGGPRYAKTGRRVIYRRDWLDEWVQSCAVENTAEAKRRNHLKLAR